MISRTYVVQMPSTEGPGSTTLDILVESAPGSQDAPETSGGGVYYELRGRPLRIPVLAADGVSAGFVPRLTLGFLLTVTPIAIAGSVAIPAVQLSESLISLSSTDSGPSISVTAFPDPNGEAAIRLNGNEDTTGVYLVCLLVAEAKDEDRDGIGV